MIKLSQFWIAVVGSIAVLISSCSGDSDPVEPIPMEVVAPDTYAWNDANGANTVVLEDKQHGSSKQLKFAQKWDQMMQFC